MSRRCCIPKCRNRTIDGFHLFRLPFTRPDILKMWIDAIGRNFEPKKSHYICSAHFAAADFMIRPNASGVRLKNLAVPSIFCDTTDTTAIESDITPTMEFDSIPEIESDITPTMEFNTTTAIESDITPTMEFNTTTAIESDITPTMEFDTSVDTIKMTTQKKRKLMDSSLVKLKKQEMSPRKKRMFRIIKTLKQKLKRKEEKISSLENLLKHLRYNL
ncbi:unnamed protein product [Lasius platythorax]|uniref:THAP-type domain-containing protein n=1 Tax=Lasius platythorax TaxID=488582 RepID=A0AAV2NFH6_9HYME